MYDEEEAINQDKNVSHIENNICKIHISCWERKYVFSRQRII